MCPFEPRLVAFINETDLKLNEARIKQIAALFLSSKTSSGL
jgi:hypothetical protein